MCNEIKKRMLVETIPDYERYLPYGYHKGIVVDIQEDYNNKVVTLSCGESMGIGWLRQIPIHSNIYHNHCIHHNCNHCEQTKEAVVKTVNIEFSSSDVQTMIEILEKIMTTAVLDYTSLTTTRENILKQKNLAGECLKIINSNGEKK